MQTKELTSSEMEQVNGGAITSSVINAIVNVVETILELGERTGSSIRRLFDGEVCPSR